MPKLNIFPAQFIKRMQRQISQIHAYVRWNVTAHLQAHFRLLRARPAAALSTLAGGSFSACMTGSYILVLCSQARPLKMPLWWNHDMLTSFLQACAELCMCDYSGEGGAAWCRSTVHLWRVFWFVRLNVFFQFLPPWSSLITRRSLDVEKWTDDLKLENINAKC